MKSFFIIFAVVLSIAMAGCSDSTESTPNYPLTLTMVTDTTISLVQGQVDIVMKVTQNGQPVSGAKLVQTDINPPNEDIFTEMFVSDSVGLFPDYHLFDTGDTITGTSFQAEKISGTDTLQSNPLPFNL